MRYKIGNSLRMLRDVVEADSDRAAWEEDRRRFRAVFPTASETGGRLVYLERIVQLPEERVMPGVREAFTPMIRGWTSSVMICMGVSNEPWPESWPDNLEMPTVEEAHGG